MNKKILMSGIFIVAALAMVGGITYAQLTSTASATDITFASENAELLIAKDVNGALPSPVAFANTQSFSTQHNVFPGYIQDFTFWLKNNSDADIPFTDAVNLNPVVFTPDGNDLNTNLTVGFNCEDKGIDGLGSGTPTTNGNFPLSAWTPGNEDLGALPSGHSAYCKMNAAVPTNVGTMQNSESVKFTANFVGTQVEPSSTPSPTPL